MFLYGLSINSVAALLNLSQGHISNVLSGKRQSRRVIVFIEREIALIESKLQHKCEEKSME